MQSGIADTITETMAQRALRMPEEPFLSVYKESDIIPMPAATSVLQEKVKPAGVATKRRNNEFLQTEQQAEILALKVDPESPESFMLRPKRRRWTCESSTLVGLKRNPARAAAARQTTRTISSGMVWAVQQQKHMTSS